MDGAVIMAGVEEVEVVVAHNERATLRVGDVFLKIDADQTRIEVEVEAMAMAPIPTPKVLWRKPPVLALAALQGRHSAASGSRRARRRRRGQRRAPPHGCCTTRRCRRGPVRALTRSHRTSRRMRVAGHERCPSHRCGYAQPSDCRGCAPAVDTGVHAR